MMGLVFLCELLLATTEDFIKFFGSLQDRPLTKDELSRCILRIYFEILIYLIVLQWIQGKKTDRLTVPKYMPGNEFYPLKNSKFQIPESNI